MPVRPPDAGDLRRAATANGFAVTDAELAQFQDLIAGILPAIHMLEAEPDDLPPVKYPHRTAGERPAPADNPLNAIMRTCRVAGAATGPLAGKRVGLKDNIALAGVPMENGSRVFEGLVPAYDATIVTRLLDAGATIVAKTVMDDCALAGSGETSAFGPVRNPHNPHHLAGGSSSGSAAAVVQGDIDIGIGTDQGGSIRIPAAWCGAVGLKPTYGLVPYTGLISQDPTNDHVGPITRTVEELAVTLEVIAGPDGLDPRQRGVQASRYIEALSGKITGGRIAVVTEGFGHANSDPRVDETVREALARFRALGAIVEDVSIPMHRRAIMVRAGTVLEGATRLLQENGLGHGWEGFYDLQLGRELMVRRRGRAQHFPPSIKLTLMLGTYLSKLSGGTVYAKAQNVRRPLRAAYDAVLATCDLLAMPTTPMTALPIGEDTSPRAWITRGWSMVTNTFPFNYTGHPSLSIPCGMVDGLPVGLMITGKPWEEATLLRAAHAFEQAAR